MSRSTSTLLEKLEIWWSNSVGRTFTIRTEETAVSQAKSLSSSARSWTRSSANERKKEEKEKEAARKQGWETWTFPAEWLPFLIDHAYNIQIVWTYNSKSLASDQPSFRQSAASRINRSFKEKTSKKILLSLWVKLSECHKDRRSRRWENC